MEITGSDSLPPSRNMSGSVMSLPVSYEMKACHYHDSIILTLQVKLQGAPKGERERERCEAEDMKSSKEYLSISRNIVSFMYVYSIGSSMWERDMIN